MRMYVKRKLYYDFRQNRRVDQLTNIMSSYVKSKKLRT